MGPERCRQRERRALLSHRHVERDLDLVLGGERDALVQDFPEKHSVGVDIALGAVLLMADHLPVTV